MYKGVESLPVNTSRSLLVPSVLVSLVVEARGGAGHRGPETLARAPGQVWDNFLKQPIFNVTCRKLEEHHKRFESRNPHIRKYKQAVNLIESIANTVTSIRPLNSTPFCQEWVLRSRSAGRGNRYHRSCRRARSTRDRLDHHERTER